LSSPFIQIISFGQDYNDVTTNANLSCFIRVQIFRVTFQNKFEKDDWSFVLKVGATIMIEQIDPFIFDIRFVAIHSIQNFI
jgi:hypothetical protein